MQGDEIAVVCAFGIFVTRTGEDEQVVAPDGHRGIVSGALGRASNGDHAGETPVKKIAREMESEAMSFVVGQSVAVFWQQVGASHAVGCLGGDQPVEP